jgi:hypothetical protein
VRGTRGKRRKKTKKEKKEKNIPEPESYPTHPSISLNPDEISIPYLF